MKQLKSSDLSTLNKTICYYLSYILHSVFYRTILVSHCNIMFQNEMITSWNMWFLSKCPVGLTVNFHFYCLLILFKVLIAGVQIVQSQSRVFYGHFLSLVPSVLNIYGNSCVIVTNYLNFLLQVTVYKVTSPSVWRQLAIDAIYSSSAPLSICYLWICRRFLFVFALKV